MRRRRPSCPRSSGPTYEYGSRAGAWRILDLFRDRGAPMTLFAVASAAARTPWLIERALADGHEIACHGLRWIDHDGMPEDVEREHIARSMEILTGLCGSRPLGWYTGRTSQNTRRLVAEYGGFLYDADDYSDDLPFYSRVQAAPGGHLVVPYTLDCNDMKFATVQGFASGQQFYDYLRDAFDCLLGEGETAPKMMSVGLHARLIGRPGAPGQAAAGARPRAATARHWRKTHPFRPETA